MPGRLPQIRLVHVGRDDLVVTALPVFLPEQVKHGVVDPSSMGQEEARAWGDGVKEKELLVCPNLSVIPLGGFR
jgi:hypothetical protein